MAKGILIGIKNVNFTGNDGKQVKYKEYIMLKAIERNGEGQECFTVRKDKSFDVVLGQEVETTYDIGFGGKAVCKDIQAVV